jgi:hypothetical protein
VTTMKPSDLITGKSAGAGIARLLGDARKSSELWPHSVGPSALEAEAIQSHPRSPDTTLSVVAGLPDGAVAEYRFHSRRRWRFDWAWPSARVALEIEGGAWTQGRHTRGAGFVADMEKYNAATLAGWRVLRVTPQQFENGEAGRLVRLALALRC